MLTIWQHFERFWLYYHCAKSKSDHLWDFSQTSDTAIGSGVPKFLVMWKIINQWICGC